MTVTLLAVAFTVVCVFLMLVILIQKPKGGGLSGAFGGSGGSAQAAFGAKTGDVLTWFTVVCFVLFLLLAVGLTWAIRPDVTATGATATQQAQQAAEPGDADLEDAIDEATESAGVVEGEDVDVEGAVEEAVQTAPEPITVPEPLSNGEPAPEAPAPQPAP